MSMVMQIKLYQICHSQDTMNNIPNGFLALDNLKNERDDWREYWPIRNFLKSNYMPEETLIGFMSPRFFYKTNLTCGDIQKFISNKYNRQDVVSFSPFWDLSSIFKNVFEQGDFFHPGLSETCQEFSNIHLTNLDLKNSITHSQNSIFCNYFLATKSFWLEWLKLGELLYSEAESGITLLSKKLNNITTYGSQSLQMKVFVQERLATMVLLANSNIKVLAYDIFNLKASNTPFNIFLNESIQSDALKITYSMTQNESYLRQFSDIRNQIITNFKSK